MGSRVDEIAVVKPVAGPVPARSITVLTVALGMMALLLAAGALAVKAIGMPGTPYLLVFAVLLAGLAVVVRWRKQAAAGLARGAVLPALQDMLDSVGLPMAAVGLDGRMLYVNPAAERLLGYHADQFQSDEAAAAILAPGEGLRLLREMQTLCRMNPGIPEAQPERVNAFLDCVRALPPSMGPSFAVQLRRRTGELIAVRLQISALRNSRGALCGVMLTAVDESAGGKPGRLEDESQEPFRDLLEHSAEMIATLSPQGEFLYANPAWRRCFGLPQEALVGSSFENLFSGDCRTEALAHFRRALKGETVERAPLRHYTADGRVLDLELSLSQGESSANLHALHCLLRDVTQQKQRENRLALQLVVSQVLGDNTPTEVAAMNILQALCVSQGWDVAVQWQIDPKQQQLEFATAWGTPGDRAEQLIQQSMSLSLPSGADLPGRAWKEERTIWISDLSAAQSSPRIAAALRQQMASGWAVPVRVGNQVLAVLEFYCRVKLRESRDTTAAVEMAAASLGQMLARTREQGRAAELSRQQQILLDTVTDGICGVDRMGLVSFVNPAAARLLGAPAGKLTGRRVHDLLHDASGRSCGDECVLKYAAEHRKGATGEETIFRADGTLFSAEYVLTPILDQGHFSGSVLSFRDISQRSALDRMKDEFISTVSHELRTPLTSIRGALGLLSSGLLGEISEKSSNLLRIALTNSDRLVRLINDILDLERIQSGREPLAFRPVQLGEVVRQAIEGMQPVADAGGVRLIHDNAQTEVEADPDRLLQVLTNLLSNAIKFSPANSTVSILLKPGTEGITLSVIDHGRGIPADKLEAIFGRFQQVDASDSRQKGGSGLGLAICRTIVNQHSGRIWAERNPVRGSTFRVFLPYHPDPLAAPAGLPDRPVAQMASAETAGRES